jgi:hypothetical protein
MLQELFGASCSGQVEVVLKTWLLIAAVLEENATVPTFESVTVCAALVVPTATLEKLRLIGLT